MFFFFADTKDFNNLPVFRSLKFSSQKTRCFCWK